MLLQVILERGEAHDQRAAFAERPQAHVDAEHETILGPHIEQPDELAAEAVEIFLVRPPPRGPSVSSGLREQEHQIDVRRKIQLAAAEFAHAEHDERHFFAALVAGLAEYGTQQQFRDRCSRSNRGVRQIRQSVQCLRRMRAPGDIAPRDTQHLAAPPLAQNALCVGGSRCLTRARFHTPRRRCAPPTAARTG